MLGGWSDGVDAYLLSLRAAGRPETTVSLRRYHLLRFAREAPTTPWDIETAHLVAWLGSHAWKPETIRSHRASLRDFYAWAEIAGHVERSPARVLPRVKATAPAPKPVRHDDFDLAMLEASDDVRLMLRLAGELGMRRGEVALVHSDDLFADLDGWSLVVHGKGAKIRHLPLPADLARELRAREAGWCFPGRVDGHVSAAWVGRLVGRLLPAGYSMHKLRHMFASDAYAAEPDLFTLQDLLGHASPETTRAYVLPPTAARRAMVTRAAQHRRTPRLLRP